MSAQTAVELITKVMETHERVALWVSGGKDSLVVVHLCRPWRERVILLCNQVDDVFPGQWENLYACTQAWGFTHLLQTHPALTYDAYVAHYGWPVDVVPTSMDGFLKTPFLGPYKVSSWWMCTYMRRVKPLLDLTTSLKPDAVLTGSRRSDAPLMESSGVVVDARAELGWMRYNPLYEWTTAEVYAYLEAEGIPLPPLYAWKREAGFDAPECRRCTRQPAYLAWMQEHLPDHYAALMQRFGPTLAHLTKTLGAYQQALGGLTDGD